MTRRGVQTAIRKWVMLRNEMQRVQRCLLPKPGHGALLRVVGESSPSHIIISWKWGVCCVVMSRERCIWQAIAGGLRHESRALAVPHITRLLWLVALSSRDALSPK